MVEEKVNKAEEQEGPRRLKARSPGAGKPGTRRRNQEFLSYEDVVSRKFIKFVKLQSQNSKNFTNFKNFQLYKLITCREV